MRAFAAGAVLLLASACSAPRRASVCTEIGASPGVGVTVEQASAAGVTALSLRVCWAGDCTDHAVELSPGSDTVDQGCEGDEPDAACSATVVPNGTLVGFVEVPGLPVGEVQIERHSAARQAVDPAARGGDPGRNHLPERAPVRAGRQPGPGDDRARRAALTVRR